MSKLRTLWQRLTGVGRTEAAVRQSDALREQAERSLYETEEAAIRQAAESTGDPALWALAATRRRELQEMQSRRGYVDDVSSSIGGGR